MINLPAALELANAATPGPWSHHEENGFPYVLGADCELLGGPVTIVDGGENLSSADSAFIAASRELVPQLIAEVEALRAALVRACDIADEWIGFRVPGLDTFAETAAGDIADIRESLSSPPPKEQLP
jgi:hypothetical protein